MKPMEKIILAERQANALIEDAKIYQENLLEKTKQKSTEKANELLSLAKKEKEEIEAKTKKIIEEKKEAFQANLNKEQTKLLQSITKKKVELANIVTKEVYHRDR
ncbi:MAG: hypothetical protein WCZ47_03825 [Bacilli bacterium]|jgi:vacuolar-type H+-ATPase subunit H|nr:hypothetical protein [Bacilli bacterium]NLN80430.1 hypothetical protein [Erysipelotrichia bacterium]